MAPIVYTRFILQIYSHLVIMFFFFCKVLETVVIAKCALISVLGRSFIALVYIEMYTEYLKDN